MSARLGVSASTYREITAKLRACGEGSRIGTDGAITLRGIDLVRETTHAAATTIDEETIIEVASILSQRTKAGRVELTINADKIQMDLDKAREVLGMLSGAIEAAVSDGRLYAFLTQKVGLSAEQAGAALLDFRELRQGSRAPVYPS